MTPYKWEETEEQYLAIVKPSELFIDGSIYEDSRYKYRTHWNGTLKTGKKDLYAFGYLKKYCNREQAEREVSWINDAFSWQPEEDHKTP